MDFLTRLFDTSDFPPRWHCGNWSAGHGWLHVLSDLGVWSAYVAIPCVLGYFLLRRRDLPFRMIFLLFGAFILACGTTHLMEALIFWWPAYRLAGVIKLLTAVVSWATVIALVPIVPRVLAMRSPEELEREVSARTKAEDALRQTNDELEHRIAERTAELVRANAELHIERERLRTTLASIGDAVIATDTEGRVTFLNPVAQDLTGWSPADADGIPLETAFVIVNETTRAPVENPALRSLREGVVVGLANHTVLIARNGTERTIDDSAAPIRDGDGKIVGCVLVFRDVSQRRQAELAQAERSRLVSLRADFGDAIAGSQDVQAVLQRCTELLVEHLDVAFARVWTLNERENVLELHASAGQYTHLDGPHGRVRVGEYKIGRIAANRQPHLTNSTYDDPNVSDRDWAKREGMVAFAGYPLVVEGRTVGVTAMFARRALSEGVLTELAPLADQIAYYIDRKRAEESLRQSERRLRFVMDSMPQKIFTATLDGAVDYFNPIWTEFTGLSFDQIREWGWTQFIHPDDVEENVRVWRHSIATGEPFTFEHRFRRADGEYRWHLSRATALKDAAGSVLMWVGSNTDVHEQYRAANELREADSRKNEFLAMLAHELRNPLAPIRNALQIVQLSGGNGEAVQTASAMMERQIVQMVRLVDDLLDVSRISRGKIELRRERVELATILRQAIETTRPAIECARHELTVTLPPRPIYLNADPVRLAQAFGNLLNNACKYSEPEGRISVSVERRDGEAVVSIHDTGVGIPPDKLHDIFEMFAQVDRSLERAQGGLGIGLTLVRRLVEMHGGSVSASSDGPGRGSEFVVRLPALADDATPTRETAAAAPTPAVGRRILVVDDNRDSADSLTTLLKLTGNETRTAYDGLEAVAAAGEFRPDVVLLDIGLPKLNGYEAARAIRERPWGKAMVLVALTGWGQDEDRQKSRDAGFDAHTVKPVDYAELMALLASLSPNGEGRPTTP